VREGCGKSHSPPIRTAAGQRDAAKRIVGWFARLGKATPILGNQRSGSMQAEPRPRTQNEARERGNGKGGQNQGNKQSNRELSRVWEGWM